MPPPPMGDGGIGLLSRFRPLVVRFFPGFFFAALALPGAAFFFCFWVSGVFGVEPLLPPFPAAALALVRRLFFPMMMLDV